MDYKVLEQDWYRTQSAGVLMRSDWRKVFREYFHKPYHLYEQYITTASLPKESNVLDLCCGMGEFTFRIAEITKASVLGIDFSKESIAVCQHNLSENPNECLSFQVGDVENVQFPDHSFDMINMAGSLSYLNLNLLMQNVCRWLKPNGYFIVVDTYGYNPFFNLKRRINYLFGKTTKQTVVGVPTKKTLDAICSRFSVTEVQFCGIFAFVGPFLRYIIGEKTTAKLIDKLDDWFPFLKKYAFKFVLCAQNPIKK